MHNGWEVNAAWFARAGLWWVDRIHSRLVLSVGGIKPEKTDFLPQMCGLEVEQNITYFIPSKFYMSEMLVSLNPPASWIFPGLGGNSPDFQHGLTRWIPAYIKCFKLSNCLKTTWRRFSETETWQNEADRCTAKTKDDARIDEID